MQMFDRLDQTTRISLHDTFYCQRARDKKTKATSVALWPTVSVMTNKAQCVAPCAPSVKPYLRLIRKTRKTKKQLFPKKIKQTPFFPKQTLKTQPKRTLCDHVQTQSDDSQQESNPNHRQITAKSQPKQTQKIRKPESKPQKQTKIKTDSQKQNKKSKKESNHPKKTS